jgi:hypothetical protein
MGPLCGNAEGLNAAPAAAAASAAAAAPVPAASALPLAPLLWSLGASGRGRHSNSPQAPLARPPKLRVTVPGPPFLGGLTGRKGATGLASAGLRVAWWMGSALQDANHRIQQVMFGEPRHSSQQGEERDGCACSSSCWPAEPEMAGRCSIPLQSSCRCRCRCRCFLGEPAVYE